MELYQIAGLVSLAATIIGTAMVVAGLLQLRADEASAKANAPKAALVAVEKKLRWYEIEASSRTLSRTENDEYAELIQRRGRLLKLKAA